MTGPDVMPARAPDAAHDLPEPARRAIAAYRERLAESGDDRPILVAWAPGRINLIGEHTDYNDGYVLPVAVDRVVALAGRPVTVGRRTTLYSVHHDRTASYNATRGALLDPRPRRLPQFARYVRSVAVELAALPGRRALEPAIEAAIAGDVPVGGGMSSSAAVTVAAATFAVALGGLVPTMEPLETARLCQRAEQRAVGVRVGIMDQAASCLGQPASALLLDCRSLTYEHIPLRLDGVSLAVFDTGVPRTLATVGYNERRGECEAALALLAEAITADDPGRRVAALRDVTDADLERYGARLPETLLRRARHVVRENARVLEAVRALRAGDAEALGALLDASHASLRDDFAVSCAELEAAVAIARAVPGVLGARLMGAGFGGAALVLVRTAAEDALDAALASEYPQRTGRQGALHRCRAAGGPRWVRVAAAEGAELALDSTRAHEV
ncbi:MAG TPA: galactokinase [Ktedonobacterales bacterium]